jgi:hypothetical protein
VSVPCPQNRPHEYAPDVTAGLVRAAGASALSAVIRVGCGARMRCVRCARGLLWPSAPTPCSRARKPRATVSALIGYSDRHG